MYGKANCLSAEKQKAFIMTVIWYHFGYSCFCWYVGIYMALKTNNKWHKIIRFITSMRPRGSIIQTELSSLWFSNAEYRM